MKSSMKRRIGQEFVRSGMKELLFLWSWGADPPGI